MAARKSSTRKSSSRKYGKAASKRVERAIGLSEARKKGAKVPPAKRKRS